jgi:hypothetical protein
VSYEAGTIVPAANFFVPKATATTLAARIFANIGGAGLANWSWIETIPAGTGAGQSGANNVVVDVFKCAGSGTNLNDAGVDFYVGIAGNTAGTNGVASGILVAEDYLSIAANPANADRGKFRRNCPLPVSGVTPDATNFTYTETYTTFAASTKVDFTPTMTNGAGGIAYWLKVDHNFIVFTVKIGTAFSTFFAGVFDSVVSGDTEVMPLVVLTASSGSFSRLPGVTLNAGGVTEWGACASAWTSNMFQSHAYTGLDRWASSSKMFVSRVALSHTPTTAPQSYGVFRGLLKAEILCIGTAQSGISPSPGDTIVIDGNVWTCISVVSGLNGVGGTVGWASAPAPGPMFIRAT